MHVHWCENSSNPVEGILGVGREASSWVVFFVFDFFRFVSFSAPTRGTVMSQLAHQPLFRFDSVFGFRFGFAVLCFISYDS